MAYFNSADQDIYEELLGRGAGDPDVHGYPDEPKDTGMSAEAKEALTDVAREEGYTEQAIQGIIETGDMIFEGML